MSTGSRAILILGEDRIVSENLKELVEFMDAPNVITAMPDDWKSRLGDARLEAMFVNPELSSETVSGVLRELSEIDPNVSIVMVEKSA